MFVSESAGGAIRIRTGGVPFLSRKPRSVQRMPGVHKPAAAAIVRAARQD